MKHRLAGFACVAFGNTFGGGGFGNALGGTPQTCATQCQPCITSQASADLYNQMGQCVQACAGDGGV